MNHESIRHNRPVTDHLHPFVYMTMAGLALWFIISVWGFAIDGYTAYLLAIVSGFIFIVVALLFVLSRVGKKLHSSDVTSDHKDPFGHWASGEFVTWQDRVRGRHAAIEILLPLAAVAFGMTAFAVVFYVTAHGAHS
jgi:hypothetical protein